MPGVVIAEPSWRLALGDYIEVVAVSPDGNCAVVGSLAGDAVIADCTSGDAAVKLNEHAMGVLAAAWAPDGDRLATGGQDGIVHIYGPDGERRASVEVGGWVATLAWSPDGSMLAVGAGRRLTLVRRDGEVLCRYDEVASTVTDVAWAPNGKRVGVTAYGGITWYDPATVPATAPAREYEWKGSLLTLELSPDGRWACGGAQDSSVHLWRLWSGDDLSMSGYPAKIEQLGFRHDSRWMAVACLGEITVWEFRGKGPADTRPAVGEAHDRHIAALEWQPGGELLATGGADGLLAVWPSARRQGQQLRPAAACEDDVSVAAVSWGGGGALVVGRADGTVEHRVVAAPG